MCLSQEVFKGNFEFIQINKLIILVRETLNMILLFLIFIYGSVTAYIAPIKYPLTQQHVIQYPFVWQPGIRYPTIRHPVAQYPVPQYLGPQYPCLNIQYGKLNLFVPNHKVTNMVSSIFFLIYLTQDKSYGYWSLPYSNQI